MATIGGFEWADGEYNNNKNVNPLPIQNPDDTCGSANNKNNAPEKPRMRLFYCLQENQPPLLAKPQAL